MIRYNIYKSLLISAVGSERKQMRCSLIYKFLGYPKLFHSRDNMSAHEVELFILDSSPFVCVLHVLSVVLRGAPQSECQEFGLHFLLAGLVSLFKEVRQLLICEDLRVHAIHYLSLIHI